MKKLLFSLDVYKRQVAGKVQETVQINIVQYSHKEEYGGVWQQLSCKGNPDGVVSHVQPFVGSAVFDFHAYGIDAVSYTHLTVNYIIR